MLVDDLRLATLGLDAEVVRWLARALRSTWFRIEPGAYEQDGPAAAVCPSVAAAMMAGVWKNGELLPGSPAWGTAERPACEVEEFAACFDLCAAESGTALAIEAVRQALDSQHLVREVAA